MLPPSGGVPNNDKLPLVIYRGALPTDRADLATEVERLYRDNGWGGCWRWGVYDFHHFHANAHEALAVFAGVAHIQFGGEGGETHDVAVGDVVLIPAGVGHRCLEATHDFQVVGGYPGGQSPDMNRNAEDAGKVISQIAAVPLPEADPIYGKTGPLMRLWRR